MSLKETIEVASVQVKGATAYEISGTALVRMLFKVEFYGGV